jgi:predicted small lipoprotein YifL
MTRMCAVAAGAFLAALALTFAGCGRKGPDSAETPEAGETADQPAVETPEPVEPEGPPTGTGRTDLESLAIRYRQMAKLMAKEDPAYRTIEALGWRIADKARGLVDKYEHASKERGPAEVDVRKKQVLPEHVWLRSPEAVRDLDLVSINAKGVALAAATLDRKAMRESFGRLKRAADRCLPEPVPLTPPRRGSRPEPEPVEANILKQLIVEESAPPKAE